LRAGRLKKARAAIVLAGAPVVRCQRLLHGQPNRPVVRAFGYGGRNSTLL